ncbi:translation initiation factor Sui1 [Pasteurella multocida subsp. gallicida str. Anand1_poultry]|nr:translation initiation factor Sui1 [Pasteurella multocida subsp. gallicida str. Anand1_poultry]
MTDTLVYSTETGRIKTEKPQPTRPKGDGIVRIQRQVSGRKGMVFVSLLVWIYPMMN